MATLFDYMKELQRILHDQKQQFISPNDLKNYINRARREVAMRGQCIRVLTPISGSINGAVVTNGGTGYTAPVVTISAPDFPNGAPPLPNGAQATASAQIIGGVITSIQINYGGSGYFQPTITITDPTGTGATATLTTTNGNYLSQGQEVYPFSGVDLSMFPGVGKIYSVRSVSIVYSNYRYSLPVYAFSTYQARIRNYPNQYSWVPTIGSQFGRGTNGSFYLYPIASQIYQMEWDCSCLPQDLETDQSVEAIPEPWTDIVPFFGAYLAMTELQAFNNARYFKNEFDEFMKRYGGYVLPGRMTNPYGRF